MCKQRLKIPEVGYSEPGIPLSPGFEFHISHFLVTLGKLYNFLCLSFTDCKMRLLK